MIATEAKQLAQSHAIDSLGYAGAEATHHHIFQEAVLVLLRCHSPDRRGRLHYKTFALAVELPTRQIQDDDIPEHKYWTAVRTGKLTWTR